MGETDISIGNLYEKAGSIYKLVVMASKRALELNEGATKLTESDTDRVAEQALQEIAEGKITYKKKSSKK